MSIEQDVCDAVKPLVADRAYLNVFQQTNGVPVWPAARIQRVSMVPIVALCGDSGKATAEHRIQIDIVVAEASGYSALETLEDAVLATMQAFAPRAILDTPRVFYDEETRTHRISIDYLIQPSSTA